MVIAEATLIAAESLFWLSICGVLYPYAGYPLVLVLLGRRRRTGAATAQQLYSISMIIPVYNEETRIDRKVLNTAELEYPAELLQIVFVSDGSTDRTVSIIREHATPSMEVVNLPQRAGKAAALNAGLVHASNEIVVFSDASIALERDALQRIVQPFSDAGIGCVSGEDRIGEAGGESLYGRYELYLRNLESHVHSIVGASGSFYAQRRALVQPFTEGMAPDFLSVLRTVEQGSRAVSEPSAVGLMTSVKDPRQEFERKVRTLIRGMTTLFAHGHLLNPFGFGLFAFALWSHKVMRWTVPFFLITALLCPLPLLGRPFYLAVFAAQLVFYLAGLLALSESSGLSRTLPGRIALYFASVNAAIVAAWYRYATGVRQELWTPSRR